MRIRVLGSSGTELPGHRPPSFLLNGKILFDAGSLTNILPAKDLLKIDEWEEVVNPDVAMRIAS